MHLKAIIQTILVSLLVMTLVVSFQNCTASKGSNQDARQSLIQAFSESDQVSYKVVANKLSQGEGHWTQLEGTLEVFYEDFEDMSRSRIRRILNTSAGERIELISGNGAISAKTGDSITVAGIQIEDSEQGLTYLAYDANGDGIEVVASPALAMTTGDQRTLVMMVNFSDNTQEPFTKDEVYDTLFNQAAAYFEETSSNKMTLSGEVSGWFTLNHLSTDCDTTLISQKSKQMAQAEGIDLSLYQRFVYVHPRIGNGCGWSGLASIGGLPSSVFLNATLDLKIVTHEVGHTLGLDHAGGCEDGTEVITDNCPLLGGGQRDYFSSMGSIIGHFNSIRKEGLGWFNEGDLLTVLTSGVYEIDTYASPSRGIAKALKIPRGIDSNTGYPQYFTIENRQSYGFDLNADLINATGEVTLLSHALKSVQIRLGEDGYVLRSWILDTTPESRFGDFSDVGLEVGKSFIDPRTGTKITTVDITDGVAQVSVELGAEVDLTLCVHREPTLSLIPSHTDTAIAGSKLEYVMTIKNNDSSYCESTSFNVRYDVPEGWVLDGSSILNATSGGGTSNGKIYVTSPLGELTGTYNLSVRATHSTFNKSSIAYSTYTVGTQTSNNAPTANNDSATTEENQPVTIQVLANDSDPDGDALIVTSTSGVYGSATINSDGSITFMPASGFSGIESFNYTISDGNGGSDSASVSVTVEAAPDTTVPSVMITSPANGSSVAPKSTLNITANASDDVQVAQVEFYVDGSLLCSDTSASYSCSFSVPRAKNKTYIIKARAIDSSGNSAEHQITVNTGSSSTDDGSSGKGGGKGSNNGKK